MKTLQKIGKSLLVPVATIPAAALTLGIGYAIISRTSPDNFIGNLLTAAGGGILDNLGLIFALGLGFGLSKDNTGNAALATLVFWLITMAIIGNTTITDPITESIFGIEAVSDPSRVMAFAKIENTFIGIVIGIISATIYNKTYKVELPTAFAFFSGRRLTPIVCSFVAIIFSVIVIIVWPYVFSILVSFGEMISGLGSVGAGLFGGFNRLLIPTGLHHALNQVFWFDIAGINDIPNFIAGDPNAEGVILGITGRYQAGFFPIMMFGLPAAALAMYHTAFPTQKKKVAGIFLAGAVTSIVTGVTEPLEFLFIFTAPILFVVHAILTGLSVFIAASMHWIAGFGFSAGAIDFLLSTQNPIATQWYMLLVQGVVFGLLYYFIFKFLIIKYNLPTLGRTNDEENSDESNSDTTQDSYQMALKIVEIIGKDNFNIIDNCATRVRLELHKIDDNMILELKKLNVLGVVKTSANSLQIIIGPKVQFITDDIKDIVNK